MKSYTSQELAAWQAPELHTAIKVQCEFGNNRFNAVGSGAQIIAASSTKVSNRGITNSIGTSNFNFWQAADAYNDKNRNTMRWAVCDRGTDSRHTNTQNKGVRAWGPNRLSPQHVSDYTPYRAVYADYNQIDGPVYERGWWSANKSDSGGNFPLNNYEFVESNFDARYVNQFSLYLTEGYANMASVACGYFDVGGVYHLLANITMQAGATMTQTLNGSGSWDIIVGFDTYRVSFNFPDNTSKLIGGLHVYVKATALAHDFARISEFQGLYIQDVSADVVSAQLNQDQSEYISTVPVGTIRADTFDIVLQNIDQLYSPDNNASQIADYITVNNRFDVSFGIDINQGQGTPSYVYQPMGVFYTDTWNIDGSAMTATANCRDFSKFLQDDKILSFGKIWQKTTLFNILTDVLNRVGKAYDEINIDVSHAHVFDIVFLKDKLIWQFFTEVAFADGAVYGFDPNGNFTATSNKTIEAQTTSLWTYDQATNLEGGSVEQNLYINSVQVQVSQYTIDNLKLQPVWHMNDGVTLTWGKLTNTVTTAVGAQPNDLGTNLSDFIALDRDLDDYGTGPEGSDGPLSASGVGGPFAQTGYLYIDQEIIQYDLRDTWSPELSSQNIIQPGSVVSPGAARKFYQLTRGILDTPIQQHNSGQTVRECVVFNPLNFDHPPALSAPTIHSTCMDDISEITSGSFPAQAKIIYYSPDGFGAKLAIRSFANALVVLSGTAPQPLLGIAKAIPWSTTINAVAIQTKVDKTTIGGPPVGRTTSSNKFSKYIRKYGKNEIVVQNPWVQTLALGKEISENLIQQFKNPRKLINMQVGAFPALQLNDRVHIASFPQLSISNIDYNLTSIRYTYDGSLECQVMVREVNAN